MRTIQLTLARDTVSSARASNVFDLEKIEVLQLILPTLEGKMEKQKNPHLPGSLAQAAWVVARLGGWKGYASESKPGPITMLRGLQRVEAICQEDRVIAEKRLPNDLAKIIGFLLPWRDELKAVVVESTYKWYWLVDGSQEAGFAVKLANPGAILPPEQRALRDLARKRMQLVRSRTGHILAIENIVARQRAMKINSNQVKRLAADEVDQMGLPADVALAAKSNLAVIVTLNEQIDLLEMGSIERFAAVGNFASYARCVDSRHMSNNKKKGEGNTKNGNKYLAWTFVEAANFALRFNAEAKRFYGR